MSVEFNLDATDIAEQFIQRTDKCVFLTGKAGTGKTTLLKKIVSNAVKNCVIVAPTGIAALNAGGVTIHSFFQLPFASFVPDFTGPPSINEFTKVETKSTLFRHFKMNKQKQQLLRNLELLIIDEVSMLRADLLDAIDWTLRNVRKENDVFGGVQVLFVGDLLQLPPVVKQEEWNLLKKYYAGIHFFYSTAYRESFAVHIELTKVFRQEDERFVRILNNLRNNRLKEEDLLEINRYVDPDFNSIKEDGYITLTTHNAKADEMNASAMRELKSTSYVYHAEITGEFPKHLYPIDSVMELKAQAKVMFIKNDVSYEKNFYNGKTGIVESLSDSEIIVHFPEEKKSITVERYEWNNIRYYSDEVSGEIKEEILGTFVHYPLKTAWAITVHKSQGLTFDKVVLDVNDVFAPGQAYVALSRLRNLNGLKLRKPLVLNSISNDQKVDAFSAQKEEIEILSQKLESETATYMLGKLKRAFDFYELSIAWNSHAAKYVNVGSKTEKAKNRSWIEHQKIILEACVEPGRKFRDQLNKLFAVNPPDLQFIFERVNAAYAFFFKSLDGVLESNLRKISELKKLRKNVSYVEELEELDEFITHAIIRLKHAQIFAESISFGREITKDLLYSHEVVNYKIGKIALVNHESRQRSSSFFESEQEELIIINKKSSEGKNLIKKNTYDQTLDLLKEGFSVSKISEIRKLTESTVNAHLVQLLKKEKISLDDIMGAERIDELKNLLSNYEDDSISTIKQKLGEAVSWEELKLYKAGTSL